MKLNQMKAFQEIMLTGSVSEAARNLNRSQPAISALVAGLEDELEMRLFERRNGRLHPVPEAHYLLQECSQLLSRVDALQQNLRGIKALKTGRLEVISMPGPVVFFLPGLLARFASEKPDFESDLSSRSSEIVYQLIAAQKFDIGLADYSEEKTDTSSLVNTISYRFECSIALSKGHELAKHDALTPKLLCEHPVATLYPEHQAAANLNRAFRERQVEFTPRFTCRYFIPLLTYVEKGLACALVDPVAVDSYQHYSGDNPAIVFRRFEPAVHYTISVLTPAFRPASLLGSAFLAELCREFERLGGQLME